MLSARKEHSGHEGTDKAHQNAEPRPQHQRLVLSLDPQWRHSTMYCGAKKGLRKVGRIDSSRNLTGAGSYAAACVAAIGRERLPDRPVANYA